MPDRLRKSVAWITLAQVALVGGLGTGLHGLLGCEHGPCCSAAGCVEAESGCRDCAFCRHAAKTQREMESRQPAPGAVVHAACCDGCALCDLLAQYHSAAPLSIETHSIELISGEAALHSQNAVVAAAIRLAFSRGPPTV